MIKLRYTCRMTISVERNSISRKNQYGIILIPNRIGYWVCFGYIFSCIGLSLYVIALLLVIIKFLIEVL